MRIVVFHPLRQCRGASFEEFASVRTWAHVEMRRLFKPSAVGALGCWGLSLSVQHFTGAAVPGSLLAIPELLHLWGLVKGGSDVVPCDGVKGVIVHEVQLRVPFFSFLSADVESKVLRDVCRLLDIVDEHTGVF